MANTGFQEGDTICFFQKEGYCRCPGEANPSLHPSAPAAPIPERLSFLPFSLPPFSNSLNPHPPFFIVTSRR